jgi:hypothetical protein
MEMMERVEMGLSSNGDSTIVSKCFQYYIMLSTIGLVGDYSPSEKNISQLG